MTRQAVSFKVKPTHSVPRQHVRKRNRTTLFLKFPIVVFAWFIGWSLLWIGNKQKVVKPKKTLDKNELTTVAMPELEYAIQHKANPV